MLGSVGWSVGSVGSVLGGCVDGGAELTPPAEGVVVVEELLLGVVLGVLAAVALGWLVELAPLPSVFTQAGSGKGLFGRPFIDTFM